MASQESAPAESMPSAQVVGSAFVQQFFLILHKSPDLVHRFYQESSKLGRPGYKGEMSMTSTLQAIDEKIMSMDYGEYRAQIKTVDAQESLNGGVLVLVTGYLIGKDNSRRDFAQTFFLATQDKGYYVLNDIFRYVEVADEQQEVYSLVNETDSHISPNHETSLSEEHLAPEQTSASLTEDEVDQEEVYDPSEHEEGSALDEELPVEVLNEVPSAVQRAVVDSGHSTVPEQKKSYASILRMMKENAAPLSSPTPAQTRAVLANSVQRATAAHAPAASPVLDVPASSSYVAESNNIQESEADGYSIYIKNLPLNATTPQLEDEFKKFGPIKPNGIQVRSNKLQGFCFGFVEFEVASSVQSAIEASPILIGGRQAYVEEKRTSGSRVNSRGRFAPGRGGGFHGDGRGRAFYGGGRGYGRSDYNNGMNFGSRGGRSRATTGRGDLGYQRVDHTAEPGRPGSPPRVPASA